MPANVLLVRPKDKRYKVKRDATVVVADIWCEVHQKTDPQHLGRIRDTLVESTTSSVSIYTRGFAPSADPIFF